ncbi:MAG: hypothetical protein LUC48_07285 [Clostridiales bacterium]|nr:hypothetical protein [Clostridiales bacterium]
MLEKYRSEAELQAKKPKYELEYVHKTIPRGRAPGSQSGGQGFDPPMVHHVPGNCQSGGSPDFLFQFYHGAWRGRHPRPASQEETTGLETNLRLINLQSCGIIEHNE